MTLDVKERIAAAKELRSFLVDWGMDSEAAKLETLRYLFGCGLAVAMQSRQSCVSEVSPAPDLSTGE